MVEIVRFKAEHAISLLQGGVVESDMKVSEPNEVVKRIAQCYEAEGCSVTILLGGKPLCSALISILWNGVAQLAALISVETKNHKIEACRAMRKVIDILFRDLELHRIQTTVRVDFPIGQRFAEWAGFTKEGIAVQHSHDKIDAYYYGFVR